MEELEQEIEERRRLLRTPLQPPLGGLPGLA